MSTVHVVLPGRAANPTAPSGGDIYDRRVCRGLVTAGWSVREVTVPGDWPRPGPAGNRALAAALAAIPDRSTVLLDGLVGSAAPEVLGPESGRLRLVVLVHLPLGDETGLAREEAAELAARERRALPAAAAVVATSGWTARRLVDHYRLPPDLVHVATPGVDPAPLAAGSQAGSRLLCVAALTPLKAQELLVTALARLADLRWSCRFVGDLDRAPAYVERVRALVRDHRLGDRVRLAGPRTGEALAAAYAAADLVVLASHAEAYGMVLTEALARGIPVVATRVGGVPEALGRTSDGSLPGMLVPPADPAALAVALRRWLTEPATRHQLRRAARARRATLAGWEATVASVTGVLERLETGATR
jgi:glycosyltransferase involved in cell wall biosynthesis